MTRFFMLPGCAVATVMLLGGVGASQAKMDDSWTCTMVEGREGIAACSRLLASTPSVRMYNQRGLLYLSFGSGNPDAAIADFTAALGLDPKDANAYSNRAKAYRAKGDRDRAIADETESRRLRDEARRLRQAGRQGR